MRGGIETGFGEGEEAAGLRGVHAGGDFAKVGAGGVLAELFETGEFGGGGGAGLGRGGGIEVSAGLLDPGAVVFADGFVGSVEFFDGGRLFGSEREFGAQPGKLAGRRGGGRTGQPRGEAKGEQTGRERGKDDAEEALHGAG